MRKRRSSRPRSEEDQDLRFLEGLRRRLPYKVGNAVSEHVAEQEIHEHVEQKFFDIKLKDYEEK